MLRTLDRHAPFALPAAWDPMDATATVPRTLVPGDLRETRASVCFDVTRGRGPAAKAGVLLRGRGTLMADREVAAVSIETERVTWWDGLAVATVAAAGLVPAAA